MRGLSLGCIIIFACAGSAFGGAIHEAIKQGKLDVVRALLEKEPTLLEEPDTTGERPLHLAAGRHQVPILRYLLLKKADVNARAGKSETASTPLGIACHGDFDDCAALLIEAGADVNAPSASWDGVSTPLLDAARHLDRTLIKRLLDKGADIKATDSQGRTAPMEVMRKYDRYNDDKAKEHDIAAKISLTLLADAKADLKVSGGDGLTLLHQAVRKNWPVTVKFLISQKLDLNAKDKKERTPLRMAVDAGDIEIINILKAAGAKMD